MGPRSRTCRSCTQRAWREENRAHVRATMRAWRERSRVPDEPPGTRVAEINPEALERELESYPLERLYPRG